VSIFSTEGAARWPPGVTEENLKGKNAQLINAKIFAEKVAAADKSGLSRRRGRSDPARRIDRPDPGERHHGEPAP
jgi:hypothetical protein